MTEPGVRAALQAAITQAMKRRDRAAAAVYRTALAAIDNAEAVPQGDQIRGGAIEQSPLGVGRAEATRRALTDGDMADVVRRDAQERLAAADSLAAANALAAERLRREARLLLDLVG
ncbi:MAG TPA: hypothetical protein VH373_11265 [Jatrophihabitantaceae bacterium]